MFDRITKVEKGRTEYVPYASKVEVTEKRAATDESIRLLNEMHEKTIENIISTVKVNNTIVECVGFTMYKNNPRNGICYVLKFKINDKPYTIDGLIDIDDFRNNSFFFTEITRELINKVFHESIFNALTKELLNQCEYSIIESLIKL